MCPNCADDKLNVIEIVKLNANVHCADCFDYLCHIGNLESFLSGYQLDAAYAKSKDGFIKYQLVEEALIVTMSSNPYIPQEW